jgi:hypothetical protein
MLVLRVVRCERRTSLTVNAGCWHALPMGIHATLMLAPGCSPWRPKSEPTTSPDAVTDGGGGADMRRASNRPICTPSPSCRSVVAALQIGRSVACRMLPEATLAISGGRQAARLLAQARAGHTTLALSQEAAQSRRSATASGCHSHRSAGSAVRRGIGRRGRRRGRIGGTSGSYGRGSWASRQAVSRAAARGGAAGRRSW